MSFHGPGQNPTEDPFSKALAESGGPKIRGAFSKYSRPGEVHGGEVLSRELFQSRDPETGDPETWKDGRPIMKAKIVVQTDERGEADDDGNPDDGRRAIYIKWWGDDLKALKEAVGKNDLETGGKFFAKFDHEIPNTNKAFSARKVYAYQYEAPAFVPEEDPWGNGAGDYRDMGLAAGGVLPASNPVPATNTQPAPVAAAPTPAAQPAPAVVTASPQDIADLMNKGFTDDDIAKTTGATPDAVAFVRAMMPR